MFPFQFSGLCSFPVNDSTLTKRPCKDKGFNLCCHSDKIRLWLCFSEILTLQENKGFTPHFYSFLPFFFFFHLEVIEVFRC